MPAINVKEPNLTGLSQILCLENNTKYKKSPRLKDDS